MPYCTCGAHVSPDWKRVVSDNDGIVTSCPNCAGINGSGDYHGTHRL